MRNLNVVSLEAAFWIARLGSFTAAAEHLHTTQPAVSARIRELESTLGFKIFTRRGRGSELTFEGREFIANVEPLLRQLQKLSYAAIGASSISGTVRLGTSSICLGWFPEFLRELHRLMPNVSYEIEIDRAARVMSQLDQHKVDLAIISGPVDTQKYLCHSLGYDWMLWLSAPAHLEKLQHQSLGEFLDDSLIWGIQRESFLWTDSVNALRKHGARLRYLSSIGNNMLATRDVLVGGGAIGLVSEAMAAEHLADGRLAMIPKVEPVGPVEFSVVCTRDHVPPVVQVVADVAARISTFRRTGGAAPSGPS